MTTSVKIPTIGEEWTYKGSTSPWVGKRYRPVKVIDVKDGWVKYDMSFLKNEEMELESFIYCYEFLEKEK